MDFGLLALADNPAQIPAPQRGQVLDGLLGPTQQLSGIQPGLDALGQLHLLLGAEQRDPADPPEIDADRIGRAAMFGVVAVVARHRGLLSIPDEVLRVGVADTVWLLRLDPQLFNLAGDQIRDHRDILVS